MDCIATVDTGILARNYENIRAKVAGRNVMAMVKRDAYGHGMPAIVEVLEAASEPPEYYGVAFLEEALELQALTKRPILITEPLLRGDLARFLEEAREGVMPIISSHENLALWQELLSRSVRVHVKVNSGMNRLGVRRETAVALIGEVIKDNRFILDGVYTHFASSDVRDKTSVRAQLGVFNEVLAQFERAELGLIHAANSGAILDLPESYFDMVRPGITLYGYYPSEETSESVLVEPVMSLTSYVGEVSHVEPGERVGYGGTYTAAEWHTIASIPMGYGDGIRRNLSNKINVLVGGKAYRQVGTISMDRMSINTRDEHFTPGQKVTLVGREGDERIDFWDWARVLGTTPYEMMCGIGPRFWREYR